MVEAYKAVMKQSFLLFNLLILGLILSACDQTDFLPPSDVSAMGVAKTLPAVHSVFVSANECDAGIRSGMSEFGYHSVSRPDEVDAVLVVNVETKGRNLDQIPEFGGFGSKAVYSAKLYGAGGKTLFTTSGKEGSITRNEMCEDIGDEIAERMIRARGSSR